MEKEFSDEFLKERYKYIRVQRVKINDPWEVNEEREAVVVDLKQKPDLNDYRVRIIYADKVYYTGDFGAFIFGRNIRDPRAFFRGKNINPDYWAEKLEAAPSGYYEAEVNTNKLNDIYINFVLDLENEEKEKDEINEPVYCSSTIESAWCAIEEANEANGVYIDSEKINDLIEQAKETDVKFIYACHVLQWVANKLSKGEE